jgi:hypothetical protein
LSTHGAIAPFTLERQFVRLEPLLPEHAGMLWEIAKDHVADLFEWIPYKFESLEDFIKINEMVQ